MAGPDDVTGRVLVIEDDGPTRAGLARSLREMGYVVAEASSTPEALGWIETWPPDVVLLDAGLPDGHGLLGDLKGDAATRDVPVVVLADPAQRELVLEALRSGAHDYLPVPYSVEELHARTQAALRTKALVDELLVVSTHDPLTGVRNRRGVAEVLSTWRAHCNRHGLPLTVVLLGVNGFKQVNEEHSHTTGDRILRAVAEQLQACVRTEDVVGRWGGDEYLVVLPGGEASTAAALVERVNARLAGQQLLPGRPVTLRAGTAVVGPGALEDDEHLLGRASVSLLQQRGPLRQLA